MCGIVSLISKRQAGFWAADVELFENLLVLDTLRGLDSTGVFSVGNHRQVNFMKIASHPYHLFAVEEYKKWRGQAVSTGRMLVGHNRKATQGSINSSNAHPFHEDNIILVHNGTLRGDHKKDHADTEVDSHALAVAFARDGADVVIPKINGAFALMWWDMEKNRLFAVRNDERPLAIVETDDFLVVLSEPWMALQLLARKNIKVKDVIEIKPGMLHEFKLGGDYEVTGIKVQEDYWTTTYMTTGKHTQRGGPTSSVTSPKPVTGAAGSSTNTNLTSTKAGTTSPLGTGLMLVKDSGSRPPAGKGAAIGDDSAEDVKLPIDSATHVPCPEFTIGQEILVKYYEMKQSANKMFYICHGKVIQPGAPEVDVMTYIRNNRFVDDNQREYMGTPVLARVVKHTVSVCGRSLYVNDSQLTERINVHNNTLCKQEWDYIQTHCQCVKCSAPIYDEESGFTSVTRSPHNRFTVTCADCVEDSLQGEMKHEFNQNRLAAVQAYEQQRLTPPASDVGTTQAAGSQTLH